MLSLNHYFCTLFNCYLKEILQIYAKLRNPWGTGLKISKPSYDQKKISF